MKKLALCLVGLLAVSGQAFASNMYFGWCGGSSRALTPGNRGVIVNAAPDSELSTIAGVDQMTLQSAYAKAPSYQWSLAQGLDSSMTPEQISMKLNGQADFFVVLKSNFEPAVHEEFPAQQLSYKGGTEYEYTRKKYDSKGNLTVNTHYTAPISVRTEYVEVPAVTHHYEPAEVDMFVYDSTGRQIFTGYSRSLWNNREDNVKGNLDYVMSIVKDYSTTPNWTKITGSKGKLTNVGIWKNPGFSFDKKKVINVAPVEVNVPFFKNKGIIQNHLESNIIGYARENNLAANRSENGGYRLEANIAAYGFHYYRVEPYVKTWSTTRDIQDRRYNHDKFYTDIDKIVAHDLHGEGCKGDVGYAIDNYTIALRLYDKTTNTMVFSYSGSIKGVPPDTGTPLLVENFFKKLKK